MNEQILKYATWGFGLSFLGFLTLTGWVIAMHFRISKVSELLKDKVSYEWIEVILKKEMQLDVDKLEKVMKENFRQTNEKIDSVSFMLSGDMNHEGVVPVLHQHKKEIREIKEKCKLHHDILKGQK